MYDPNSVYPGPPQAQDGIPVNLKMTPSTNMKQKCRNFFSFLLEMSSKQSPTVATNVRTLIQDIIDGKIEEEEFSNRLQKEVNSQPQPCLIHFLKKCVPALRQALANKELSLEGIRPPYTSPINRELRQAELASTLGHMMMDPSFADLTITTTGSQVLAHKAILAARSPVFHAMLTTPMLEWSLGTVEITDFDEPVVKAMLEYIYTGVTEGLSEMASDLLQISEKYDVRGLKEDCELELAFQLTVENATDVLVLADSHNAPGLKTKTIQFIKQHEAEVKNTVSFQNLAKNNPQLVVEVYFYS